LVEALITFPGVYLELVLNFVWEFRRWRLALRLLNELEEFIRGMDVSQCVAEHHLRHVDRF